MPGPEVPKSIKFHYIKSTQFRVIHAEGAIGGITPTRDVFISLFNERAALPQMTEFTVSAEGTLGAEIAREGKRGLVREMEVAVLLSATAAKNLAQYLIDQVKLIEESEPATQNKSPQQA
jgi:hypothetical protein